MTNKVIFLIENTYFGYDFNNENWQQLTVSSTELVEQDYIDFGIDWDDLPNIPEASWAEHEHKNVKVLAYTDSPDIEEITVETETDEYTIYDEFGDSMEVLYYTDDPDKEDAELHITANYSPLDELEGDFEVVTRTDEEDAELVLHMNAIPKPHMIEQVNPIEIQDTIMNMNIIDDTDARFLFSSDKTTWRKWNGTGFVTVDKGDIETVGMKADIINQLSQSDWDKWTGDTVYIGVYLDENTVVESISYTGVTPQESTEIEDAKLYILNTVSTINVDFVGSTLTGIVDDEDQGRVQYRVMLNGEPFYPTDGSFTQLAPSPLNINLMLTTNDYLIDESNTLRVEFKDFWGTVDYWQQNFIGTYNGLLFTDTSGEYYSTDIGEILKYLDFGVIIAGQNTIEHEIRLKNTYGYAVENVRIYAKTGDFPAGMKAQFGSSLSSFEAAEELNLPSQLEDGEETSFYIRLTTQLGVTPPTDGKFDIVVVADKVDNTV